jgi:hypothetical protein
MMMEELVTMTKNLFSTSYSPPASTPASPILNLSQLMCCAFIIYSGLKVVLEEPRKL